MKNTLPKVKDAKLYRVYNPIKLTHVEKTICLVILLSDIAFS